MAKEVQVVSFDRDSTQALLRISKAIETSQKIEIKKFEAIMKAFATAVENGKIDQNNVYISKPPTSTIDEEVMSACVSALAIQFEGQIQGNRYNICRTIIQTYLEQTSG